jgi:hypothetical protein
MTASATILFHPSQFPEAVRGALLSSLRERQVNHKFLYDGYKQTQKWLELHEAFSPARTDPECGSLYEQTFAEILDRYRKSKVRVVGLGCGGGQKDAQLLRQLATAGCETRYTAVDVSAPMVLTAREAVAAAGLKAEVSMVVCDLAEAQNLSETLFPDATSARSNAPGTPSQRYGPVPKTGVRNDSGWTNEAPPLKAIEQEADADELRLFTVFGMIPNFEPLQLLPLLAAVVRRQDGLLLSANLAPGPIYSTGVQKILPLYDNSLTREWLWLFLSDLGFAAEDGAFDFGIEPDESNLGLLRVVARFHFGRETTVHLGAESFTFRQGENLRVFFSYRHTPQTLTRLLAGFNLRVVRSWITSSLEEGIFLVENAGVAVGSVAPAG